MKRELIEYLLQQNLLPYSVVEVEHVDYTSGNYVQVSYVYNKSLSQKQNGLNFLNNLLQLEEDYELEKVLYVLKGSGLTFASLQGGVLA